MPILQSTSNVDPYRYDHQNDHPSWTIPTKHAIRLSTAVIVRAYSQMSADFDCTAEMLQREAAAPSWRAYRDKTQYSNYGHHYGTAFGKEGTTLSEGQPLLLIRRAV